MFNRGLDKRIIKKRITLKMELNKRPCLNAYFPELILFEESASATSGVMAVVNPIPRDIAIKIKLFPSDTAASSAVPS